MSPLAALLVPMALIFGWALYRAVRAGIDGERRAVAEYRQLPGEDEE